MDKKVIITALALVLSIPVKAGVMEELVVDPDTGFVIAVLDEEEADAKVSSKHSGSSTMKQSITNQGADTSNKGTKAKSLSNSQPRTVSSPVRTANSQHTGPDSVVRSSQVTQPVRQPTVFKTPAQNALAGSVFSYARVVRPSERVHINNQDGLVYFHLRKGSLKENIVALLEATSADAPVMGDISDNHQVSADMWLSGENVFEVLDAILLPYNKPYPIYAEPRGNRIVEVKYDRKRIFGGR